MIIPQLLVNNPWLIAYTVNGETQTLQLLELSRSDSEETSGRIENSASGIHVSFVGLGGQQNGGGTLWNVITKAA